MEFALIALPLFAIVTAVMDYGWFFATQHVLQNVTHHAARTAATTPQRADAQVQGELAAKARWEALGLPGEPSIVVSVIGDPQVVRVTVSKSEPYVVGLVPVPTMASVSIQRRMEEQPREDEEPMP